MRARGAMSWAQAAVSKLSRRHFRAIYLAACLSCAGWTSAGDPHYYAKEFSRIVVGMKARCLGSLLDSNRLHSLEGH